MERKVNIFAPPPGALRRGQKVKYHLISITKSISKIFIPNFVCVLTNEDKNYIRRDFHYVAWVMPQGWDFGALGVPRWSIFFFKHGHVAYQIDKDDEQNRMQVKFSFEGQADDLGVRSKVKYH